MGDVCTPSKMHSVLSGTCQYMKISFKCRGHLYITELVSVCWRHQEECSWLSFKNIFVNNKMISDFQHELFLIGHLTFFIHQGLQIEGF